MRRQLEIHGPSIRLRYPSVVDADALLALASDPEVTRYFSWGPYRTLAEPLAYIARQTRYRRRGERLEFVVEHNTHGVVGVTGLSEFSWRDRRAVVGTWFGRQWWGSGINLESKALIAHLAFAMLGCERLSAYSNVEHVRSAWALKKAGFKREGTLRAFHRHGDTQLDVFVWSLLRNEWELSSLREVEAVMTGSPPRGRIVPT
jgi:[ribosomal protein S5]-alanine N-acetyltransferase